MITIGLSAPGPLSETDMNLVVSVIRVKLNLLSCNSLTMGFERLPLVVVSE